MKFGLKHLFGLAIAGFIATGASAELTDKDFREIKPAQSTEPGNKVEVIEFFWYGCPHCFDLEPTLKKWLANKPADVVFKRVPAIFRQSWVAGAQTYYTLETMGELDRLHSKVFDAIHVERQSFNDISTISGWMGKNGIDSKKFEDTAKSFAVSGKVQRAQQMSAAYQLTGVPALVVDGKYIALGSTFDGMLSSLDQLIERARAERASARK
ncbi:MAG: thiol:disulfide interchange protein DsbA/DsbL [Gammaproteobacteria bacterium]|jgi:protein dithiol oxidoreductase (disulfide-forming)|nr:thiol:disulfide interchange protein DsbA/DsbL [Gammaproteobacteria bacterium]MBU0772277.1 thiol:disulfide interchange protein DsbA/DsbL [Gammaproteobacteria bacterium]MBU0857888.1 thiol:disulfide interchange protein DsbA/DsbL [Gammaproteobacteria bacterium]MBU1848404.1 thiol:disulfide interchange protein DsbA/DsbL [Gammaproteobacteria bacterium]